MPREFGTDPYGILAKGPPGGGGSGMGGIGGSGIGVGRVGLPINGPGFQTHGTGMGATVSIPIGGNTSGASAGVTNSTTQAPGFRDNGRRKLFAKGGKIDGVAKKGKTSGKIVKMAKGGKVGGKGDGIAKRGRTKGRIV